jgi:hypothetical protein
VKFDAFFYLLGYRLVRVAVGWIKCIIVAIRTSAPAFRTIPVGACKSRIHTDFLNPFSEKILKIRRIGIVASVVLPGILHSASKNSDIKKGIENEFNPFLRFFNYLLFGYSFKPF